MNYITLSDLFASVGHPFCLFYIHIKHMVNKGGGILVVMFQAECAVTLIILRRALENKDVSLLLVYIFSKINHSEKLTKFF